MFDWGKQDVGTISFHEKYGDIICTLPSSNLNLVPIDDPEQLEYPLIFTNSTMFVHAAFMALVAGVAATVGVPQTTWAAPPAFTYNDTSFLLHGEPYTIIGGQMDPQRIPYPYWRDRLAKARAMGLNTIFSYIFWDNLAPTQGVWLAEDPQNDVAEYFRIAQEEGLYVVLRPGPYICGEHAWGGFPSWLSSIPGMVVRTDNAPFLEQSKNYIVNLAEKSGLADLQASRGGPILMVQVENEYGSFDENHNYTVAMRDILRASFEVPLYTNDGGVDWTLEGGQIPFVLAEIDGGSWALPARDLYITDPTELGPLLDGGEFSCSATLHILPRHTNHRISPRFRILHVGARPMGVLQHSQHHRWQCRGRRGDRK